MSPSTQAIDELRHRLTPQMRDYDRLLSRPQLRWRPHIMFFHPESHRSSTVNTDPMGFRLGVHPSGYAEFSPLDLHNAQEVNLLVGGSVVFGLGSSADSRTLSSQLTLRGTLQAPWLNLGGRGFTSTQELILFLLVRHRLPRIRHIVLLSGLNNLLLAGTTAVEGDYFGEFFFSSDFYEAMQRSNDDAVERQPLLRSWFNRSKPATEAPGRVSSRELDIHERIAQAVRQVQRDLQHWRLLAQGLRARLSYAAQPLASWPQRTLHPSERTLFAALDQHAANAGGLLDAIRSPEVGREYTRALQALCAADEVTYIDLMSALEAPEAQRQWLFVDRAHFTDQGYDILATALHRSLETHQEPTP
jgi:hypothetical protein